MRWHESTLLNTFPNTSNEKWKNLQCWTPAQTHIMTLGHIQYPPCLTLLQTNIMRWGQTCLINHIIIRDYEKSGYKQIYHWRMPNATLLFGENPIAGTLWDTCNKPTVQGTNGTNPPCGSPGTHGNPADVSSSPLPDPCWPRCLWWWRRHGTPPPVGRWWWWAESRSAAAKGINDYHSQYQEHMSATPEN